MAKFFKISGIVLSVILLLMVGLAMYIRSDRGQKTVQNQLQNFLSQKLTTPYSIGRLSYNIPDWVELEDVYFEDPQKDTLLMAGRVRIDLDMFGLLTGDFQVNTIELEGGIAKLYTINENGDFNYRFLIDAFSSGSDTISSDSSESNSFRIDEAKLKNTRFSFRDETAGIDFGILLKEGSAEFSDFNVTDNFYGFSGIVVDSAETRLLTFIPTVVNQTEGAGESVKLELGDISLSDFSWKYDGEDIGVENTIKAGKAEVSFNKIDLSEQRIELNEAFFENADIDVFFKQPLNESTGDEGKPWTITLAELELQEGKVHYRDNLAQPVLKPGEFNSSDFTFSEADIKLRNFYYDGNEIKGEVTEVKARERSGLNIEELAVNFAYTDQLIALRDLSFETPYSDYEGEVILSYHSLDDFINDPLTSKILIRADRSQIAFNDIFKFNADLKKNPGLAKNTSKSLRLNGSIKSNQDNFLLQDLQVTLDKETRLFLNGFVGGVKNLDNLRVDLNIEDLRVKRDLYQDFIPDSVDVSSYQLPETISMNGLVKGNAKALQLDGNLSTDLGEITLKGLLKNAASDSLRSYAGYLKTTDLNLQKLYKEEQEIGLLTAELQVNGNADLSSITADGQIQSVVYKDYSYKDINLDVNLEDSILILKANSADVNARLNADFRANLSSDKSAFKGIVDIQKLNLQTLNISDLEDDISGRFNVDLAFESETYLVGTTQIAELKLGGKNAGNLNGNFLKDGTTQQVKIDADYMNFDLISKSGLLSFADNFSGLVTDSSEVSAPEGRFELSGQLVWSPLWESVLPGVYFDQPVKMDLTSDGKNFDGQLNFQQLRYQDYVLSGWETTISGSMNDFKSETLLESLDLGETALSGNVLLANLENDVFQFDFQTADSAGNTLHQIAFEMENMEAGQVFEVQKLSFGHQDFQINDHKIRLIENQLLTDGLVMQSDNQKIALNANNEWIALNMEGVNIEPFYHLLYSPEVDLKASLNGDLQLRNNLGSLSGKAEINLAKLTIDNELIGDFQMNLSEFDAENIVINGSLKGPSSDAEMEGEVNLADEGNLDLVVDLKRLDAALIRAFSAGQVAKAAGELFGKIELTSTFTNPQPKGTLGFRKFDVTPTYLGVPLAIDNQELRFDNKNVFFNEFTVKDSTGQALVFDGRLNWSDLDAVSYQLDLQTTDFLLLNTAVEDNDLVYGTLKMDADLKLQGVGEKPSVDGRVKIKEGSDLTFIMPADIETAETQGIVYFVPPKDSSLAVQAAPVRDTLSAADAFAEVVNEILVAVETDEEAKFTFVVDEINGDKLDFSGTSNLTYGLYPNGQQYLIGSFDLTRGSYSFSLEVFKREFQVLKGSKLTWNGDPYQAELDITASYEVSTDIQSLNAFGLNSTSYGKVPLDVLLKLTGKIEEPEVNFDVKVSDKAENSIKSLISSNDVFSSLRQNSSEMNQQVFSLILFNRFMSNQFLSFSGNGFNGESVARQSVSKLLTEQLNILAGNLLGGVGLSFGVDSEVLQGAEGSGSRTEFNLGLSQSFLNDRIRVSLGKNFELANSTGVSRSSTEVLDNINIEYLVTPDGRYVAKVYRNNEYQTLLEGFVVETGVGFELRADYDKVAELFNRKQNQ
ncbi:translocation/assembly module TamB domain-containing protein [Jiulongibacter sediminis]|uniref:Translocation and assembly module TamB C-terminal domain-containing protein n=1 Tax=Jiulongibacter sediminis TaxID=1605367 RepID=A0A0P7BYT4_9BACT|nr:translocation/assembly module TamB domain-containing protein [Jiulongibacter sediminis]KPM46731.1 hypothetical protein AFM12_18340 [Jiulongibacter sediminis]TBX21637.1 hypothetical protein TK44_18345 [Jiulongibacter sediminis]